MELFGIPMEIIAGIATGIAGFFMKAQANALQAMKDVTELQIKQQMAADQLATAAAERSSPIARKVLAYLFVGGVMFGLLFIAVASLWKPEAMVSLVGDAPQKSLLWGLIKWGGGAKVTVAHGFVLPPWTGYVVSIIIGFFFGTGAAKPVR